MIPILETERLILREIKKEDSENIFACFSNNDVTRYYGQQSFQNIEQAEQLVEFFSKNTTKKEAYAGESKEKVAKV